MGKITDGTEESKEYRATLGTMDGSLPCLGVVFIIGCILEYAQLTV